MASGTEELSIIVRMRDFATRQFQTLSGTIGKWAQTGIQKVGQFAASFLSFRGIIATFASIWAGMKLVEEIAHIENMDNAFANLTKGVGGASAVLKAMQDATHGATCEIELMEAANRAILLGVGKTAKEFGDLAELSRRLGNAVGVGTIEAFDALTNSIAKQNSRALIQIGLTVKGEEAYEKYADMLSVDVKQLNEVQKQQAFANAVFEQGRKKVSELGEDTLTLSDRWGQFKESIMDIAQSLMRDLIPTLKTAFSNLSEWVNKSRPLIVNFASDMVAILGEFAIKSGPLIEALKTVLVGATKLFVVAAFVAQRKFNEFSEGWNKLWGNIEEGPANTASSVGFSMKSIGEGLLGLAKNIRASAIPAVADLGEGLDDLGRECDTVNLVRDFQETLKAQDATYSVRERQHGKWLNDLGDLKKAEESLARALAEENKELEKVIETWQKRTVAGGVLSAFQEMKSKSEEWGRVMHEGITAATDAIGSGIVDGLMAMSENFRNAAQAARQMAISIVRDLARIALQLAITQALQAGFGALFGGSAISVPAGNYASVSAADRALVHTISPVAPGFQHGGYKSRSGLAIVGEAGPELVHLPGGSRVYPNSALGGGNTTVVIHNHNPQFRTREQEEVFTRQQEEQILAVVARKKNSSVMFSEAMS